MSLLFLARASASYILFCPLLVEQPLLNRMGNLRLLFCSVLLMIYFVLRHNHLGQQRSHCNLHFRLANYLVLIITFSAVTTGKSIRLCKQKLVQTSHYNFLQYRCKHVVSRRVKVSRHQPYYAKHDCFAHIEVWEVAKS